MDSPPTRSYRRLDAVQIVETLNRLSSRIHERFSDASLFGVSQELLSLAEEVNVSIKFIRTPAWPLRFAIAVLIALATSGLALLLLGLGLPANFQPSSDIFQTISAAINTFMLLAAGVFFLVTIELRLKRRRALTSLHALRSLVHVIDMHQLTKDPEQLLAQIPDTASSPKRTMSAPNLGRYLDYCSELASLASKLAAVFGEHLYDPVVLATIDEIESLATGLSGKIWQKITLLDSVSAR